MKRRKVSVKRKRWTAEEEAINRGIEADPDTYELTVADFKRMEPLAQIIKRRGRPKSATHKIPVTIRLESGVVDFFRASGRGWQTRVNDTLVEVVARKQRRKTA